MEMNKFIEKLKSCKKTEYDSSHFNYKDEVRIYSYSDTHKEIRMEKFCMKCNHAEIKSGISIHFKISHQLTIFECGLIVFMYAYNQIPSDYAQYHKTKSGQEFIDNIIGVDVL